MMRFIDLGKQIAVDETDPDYPREFAFYDTVCEEFININGMGHVWSSWIDILKCCGKEDSALLDRLWKLTPNWAKSDIDPNWEENLKHVAKEWANPERAARWADNFFRPSPLMNRIRGAR